MGEKSRPSIQSIQAAREKTYPHNTARLFINRGDLPGGEAIGVGGAMPVETELLLPEIEQINAPIFSPPPQQAAPILINRDNSVIVEAIGVAFIVLKTVAETLGSPIKILETLAQ